MLGILHLSSRMCNISQKGHIHKPFTPIYTSNINNEIIVKTKKTEMTDIFALINPDTNTVLEYYQDLQVPEICKIISKSDWTKCELNTDIDLTPNRTILNHINYTIDPTGSLDRDDAIGIVDNKIYISIADPSSYVEMNSPFDKELERRCFSIYIDKVQHMFPEPYSTEIISLTEGKLNRAFTLECEIEDNRIINHKFYKSLIKVVNLTYDNCDGYPDVIQLNNFANKYTGQICDMHKLVEVYMIICNEYVARELQEVISISRYNKQVDLKTIENENLNLYLRAQSEAATYENSLTYSGHANLNLTHYTHFTSPLRRYADIIVHRILYNKLNNSILLYNEETINRICTRLNRIESKLKFCYNLDRINKIVGDNNEKELECKVVFFDYNDTELNYIKVYSDEYKIMFNIQLFHQNIKKFYKIESNQTELTIYSDKVNKIKLFDIIKIKIFRFKKSARVFQTKLDLII